MALTYGSIGNMEIWQYATWPKVLAPTAPHDDMETYCIMVIHFHYPPLPINMLMKVTEGAGKWIVG